VRHSHGKCEGCRARRAEVAQLGKDLEVAKLALRDARTANAMLRVRPPRSAIELAALAAWMAWQEVDEASRQHIRRAATLSPALGRACRRIAILLVDEKFEERKIET
jgi:hypothetical protein